MLVGTGQHQLSAIDVAGLVLVQIEHRQRQAARFRRRHQARDVDVRIVRTCGSRSEEHTSELQSLMRISYAVFCLKKKKKQRKHQVKTKRTTTKITCEKKN